MGCYAFRLMLVLVCLGCAGRGVPQWNQFHGDLTNTGYQPKMSGFAVAATWKSAAYQITTSSPVVGKDYERREIVYFGTTDGFLVAIHARDGRQKWARSLGPRARIVSSPAVSSSGDVFVISGQEIGGDLICSTLHKLDPNGNLRWSFSFPENGFTTGSPKVWTSSDATLVCAYVLAGRGSDLHGELVVVRDSGKSAELLDRKSLGACRWDESKTAASENRIESDLKAAWDSYSRFPVSMTDSGTGQPPDRFIDPSPAVFAGKDKATIAVVDNLCSLGAFQWDGSRLSVLWRESHRPRKHSSVAVLPNGLMIFGCDTGSVYAYDVATGVKVWQYEAGEPVLATPAAAQQILFVVSQGHLQVLRASDGTLLHENTQVKKIALIGETFGSPAITADRVYVASHEMLTVSHDLKTRVHDTNFLANAASSMAVGIDGAIYAVASDGTIWKYAGTR